MTLEITHVDPKEAARLLGREVQTLANWRARGYGPRWRKDPGKNGRVQYPLAGIHEWLAKGERRSTAENAVEQAQEADDDVDIFS